MHQRVNSLFNSLGHIDPSKHESVNLNLSHISARGIYTNFMYIIDYMESNLVYYRLHGI